MHTSKITCYSNLLSRFKLMVLPQTTRTMAQQLRTPRDYNYTVSQRQTNSKTSLPLGTVVLLERLTNPKSRHLNGKYAKIISPFNTKSNRYLVELLNTPSNNKGNVHVENMSVITMPEQKQKSTKQNYHATAMASININVNGSKHSINNKPNGNYSTVTNNNLSTMASPNVTGMNVKENKENVVIRPRMNTARFFSCKVMKSQQNRLNGKLMKDFETILNGNCIYIPKFYNKIRSETIFNQLIKDMNKYNPPKNDPVLNKWNSKEKIERNQKRLVFYSTHGEYAQSLSQLQSKFKQTTNKHKNNSNRNNNKHINNHNYKSESERKTNNDDDNDGDSSESNKNENENDSKVKNKFLSPIFEQVCNDLSEYFDVNIYVTLLNYYENGNIVTGYHSDRLTHSKMNMTIGISFGSTRNLCFLHPDSQVKFSIPQRSGDVFAFTTLVNSKFKHGVPKMNKKSVGPRFSVIVFGSRRALNQRNSGSDERAFNNC